VRDVGHTLIFGPTGNGKSTLVGLICAQFLRYPRAQIFIFDKGLSAYPLCKAVGGAHYAIASGQGAPAFYPLKHLDTPMELNRACEWIALLLECQGKTVTDQHRKEIRRALIHLADQEKRTLTHYQSTVQDQSIKDALAFYTLSGAMGEVLDAEDTPFSQARLHVFEMEELLRRGPASFLPTIAHIFNEIEIRCQQQDPTLIVVEELPHFLQGNFGQTLETWFREKRKSNVSVVGVDQTLAKIMESPCCHSILENCFTYLFLPNLEADTELNAPYYRKLGLTDRQIDIIKSALPKRHYYYCSPLGRRLMDLGMGDVALSFVGVDGKKDRLRIDALIKQHSDKWVYHWLKERGLSDWAEYWLSLQCTFIPATQEKIYA
jgi:type IV secretion system protein VirB4